MKYALIPLVIAAVAAAAVPTAPRRATVSGPKVFVIGKGQGVASSSSFDYSGFAATPTVSAQTAVEGAKIQDIVVMPKESGAGSFRVNIEYAANAPNTFEVIVYVAGGDGMSSGGFERHRIEVRRAN